MPIVSRVHSMMTCQRDGVVDMCCIYPRKATTMTSIPAYPQKAHHGIYTCTPAEGHTLAFIPAYVQKAIMALMLSQCKLYTGMCVFSNCSLSFPFLYPFLWSLLFHTFPFPLPFHSSFFTVLFFRFSLFASPGSGSFFPTGVF
ncbi:hypothetical protein BKA93DRAFT_351070 [Sparassis latifolia]